MHAYEYTDPHTKQHRTFTFNEPNVTHVVVTHNASKDPAHVGILPEHRHLDQGHRFSAHDSLEGAQARVSQHLAQKADSDPRIATARKLEGSTTGAE